MREGSFKGSYRLNLKEQMEGRMGRIWGEGSKVKVVMLGGSQIGRICEELVNKGREAVEVEGWVKVNGRFDRNEMERVLDELEVRGSGVDKVVLGGPGNSLFRHGRTSDKGFCPERTIKLGKNVNGEVRTVKVEYHLTDPAKLNVSEKRELVDLVSELVKGIGERLPGVKIIYVTMFPRHVRECCGAGGHITEDDVHTINGFRRAVDVDIVEELDEVEGVSVVQWWELMGWDDEGGVVSWRKKGIVGSDGVHLSMSANRFAAVSLCYRLAERELMREREDDRRKRMKR